MGKYLRKFETEAAYTAAESGLILPNVSLCVQENEVHYNPIILVTGVTLNKSELSLNKGDSEALVATVLPNDASNKNVTWSSSNDSVVTVSNNGLVTAVGAGNAVITVTTTDGGFTAQCSTTITVLVTGVSLNKNVLELNTEATETLVATVVPNDAADKSVTWSSSDSNIATVTQGGVVSAVSSGNCVITVTTTDGGFTAQCSTTVGHSYVDLGLPSGTKWATMNVGASSITDYGNYYQYGKGSAQYAETSGKTNYYTNEDPLAASADTATQVWGDGWHMPTQTQLNELTANTTYQWVTDYQGSGKNGVTFTANGQTLFIPAAGEYNKGSYSPSRVGSYVIIWSSTPNRSQYAYYLWLNSDVEGGVSSDSRFYGHSVRPVMDA